MTTRQRIIFIPKAFTVSDTQRPNVALQLNPAVTFVNKIYRVKFEM